MIASRIVLSILFFLIPLVFGRRLGPGSCHPYSGAKAAHCLMLIAEYLNDSGELPCDRAGRASLNYQTCSIVTKCAPGQTGVEYDTMMRRALATIGSCAFNDRAAISGTYIAEDGSKTCYLFAGSKGDCN